MNSKNKIDKTAETWTTSIEEMLINAGLTPKEGNKTGSIIMPVKNSPFGEREGSKLSP